MAFVLKQAEEGMPIGEVCRKAGIAESTFYSWRKRFAGLILSDVKACCGSNAFYAPISTSVARRQSSD
ncbi:transposase [Paenochrobactrum gallinarii]|uniref:transposase n=1 Tax=Paenochrobactrum gallinarii TaxID=643673 RepID=UPI0035BC5D57